MCAERIVGHGAWRKELGLSSSPLIICSGAAASRDAEDFIQWVINERPQTKVVVKGPGEPDFEMIDQTANQVNPATSELIAIGGGSCIDLAKAVASQVSSGQSLRDVELSGVAPPTALPVTAVPTTCGSGSEATSYLVVNNPQTNRKSTLSHPTALPQRRVMDPALLRSQPRKVLLDSAFDAFTHLLEACLKPNQKKVLLPQEAMLARSLEALSEASKGRMDMELLSELMAIAEAGGEAINERRTGLIHTLSVALAPFTDDSHGGLNRRITPYVLGFNVNHYGGDLAAILNRNCGMFFESDSDALKYLNGWVATVSPPVSKSTASRPRGIVDFISARVSQDSGLQNQNHRPVLEGDLRQLVIQIIDGF